ncbi:MAG TPA: DUF4349 domain-containing protein [Thermoanaerobaculia bacterium]|nr:DUF4349 domain-containing protein [Thermoanaerobaculia bacterium]
MKKAALLLVLFLACTHHHDEPSRRATMRIAVADTVQAVEAVTASAEAAGGELAAAEIWREGEQLRARLTLRVPPSQLTPTLAAIRRVAQRVDSESVHAR